jgi:hypothetical protein
MTTPNDDENMEKLNWSWGAEGNVKSCGHSRKQFGNFL